MSLHRYSTGLLPRLPLGLQRLEDKPELGVPYNRDGSTELPTQRLTQYSAREGDLSSHLCDIPASEKKRMSAVVTAESIDRYFQAAGPAIMRPSLTFTLPYLDLASTWCW